MKQVSFVFVILLFVSVLISCEDKNEDVKLRAEAFLNETFNDNKIIDIDNVSDKELSEFVFHQALYKGTVHKRPLKIGEGLTIRQIEDNSNEMFGTSMITRVNYDYIQADYDEENGVFVPWIYGAPSYRLTYVIHNIKRQSDNVYETVVSYIDSNADISAFDTDGNRITIADMNGYTAEEREKAIDDLKKEILKNPENYEKINLLLEIADDHIYFLKIENEK